MNWEFFSPVGYASVALWVCIPALWLVHLIWRPRRWVAHLAVPIAIAGMVLAKVHSTTHISRFEIDRSAQVQEQLSRQAMAHQAAQAQRAEEVADIRFAEDTTGEFFDKGGLDDAGLDYFERIDSQQTPAWKKHKQARTEAVGDDDLESLIGAKPSREGVEVTQALADEGPQPILVSERGKLVIDRLDKANLNAGWVMLVLALLFLVFDYLRRLNRWDEAYFPLPVPSAWADALTPRDAVAKLPENCAFSLQDELAQIVRRGEVFVYCTDDAGDARSFSGTMPRLPLGAWPIPVRVVGDDATMDNDFVFETLWFGRSCFTLDSSERAIAMLDHIIMRLAERRASRAHTRRTVHIVWDLGTSIPPSVRRRFETLGAATGFRLLVNTRATQIKPQARPGKPNTTNTPSEARG